MTAIEVAAYLNIKISMVYDLAGRGLIPNRRVPYGSGGGRGKLVFELSDIDAYKERCRAMKEFK